MSEERMAINRLLAGNTAHSCKADYIKLAIGALEKQDAKKLLSIDDEYARCPVCNHIQGGMFWGQKYCQYCGQKLDWSK